jgi:ubiquinone biosynthesis protein Coq4
MPNIEKVKSLQTQDNQSVLHSLRIIQVAIDPASPLCGKVDLDFLLKLPQNTIQEIYDTLTEEERLALKTLYGNRK